MEGDRILHDIKLYVGVPNTCLICGFHKTSIWRAWAKTSAQKHLKTVHWSAVNEPEARHSCILGQVKVSDDSQMSADRLFICQILAGMYRGDSTQCTQWVQPMNLSWVKDDIHRGIRLFCPPQSSVTSALGGHYLLCSHFNAHKRSVDLKDLIDYRINTCKFAQIFLGTK